jgi:peptide-methionine (S)-S-oxide reductase
MTNPSTEIATLGGGCFWCTEAIYQQMRGILKVESGYAGGTVPNPTYKEVCTGSTGHAEVVRITFDPSVLNYRELLEMFLTIHNPTTLNRQGEDVGTQYRSVIFYHDAEQQKIAQEVKKAMASIWDDPIVTEVSAAPTFYPAEDYHQNYYRQNTQQGYCSMVIAPKVAKARKLFASKLIS